MQRERPLVETDLHCFDDHTFHVNRLYGVVVRKERRASTYEKMAIAICACCGNLDIISRLWLSTVGYMQILYPLLARSRIAMMTS